MQLLDTHTSTPIGARILSLFPPPRIMRMHGVGVDVSDTSLKYISLERTGRGVEIGAYGTRDVPEGVIEKGRIKNADTLSNLLIKIRKQHGFEFAHVSLPEDHAYLFETEVPHSVTDSKEMKTVIEFRMKENVPLSAEEVVFDFMVVGKAPSGNHLVMVSAYVREVLEEYRNVFQKSGVHPLSFEVEGQAGARAVVPRNDKSTYMLVDFGKRQTGISIIRSGALAFAVNVGLGGDNLTGALAKVLGKTNEEAEKVKQTTAFLLQKGSDDISGALAATVAALRDEINRHYLYWHAHHEGDEQSVIQKMYLIGGGANLLGLAEYLSGTIDVPVERGDVWANTPLLDVPDIDRSHSFEYGTVIGLALRSIHI